MNENMMSNLSEALQEIKAEVLQGADFEAVLPEIAEEYALNPILVRRKFEESFGTVEAVAKNAAAMDIEVVMTRKVQLAIEVAKKSYRVPADYPCTDYMVGDKRYTLICRVAGAKKNLYVAVCHENARRYRLNKYNEFQKVA